MPAPTPSPTQAIRRLQRILLRRRLLSLDPWLRGELVLLGLLLAGFVYWQVRVPLDGLVRARGPLTGAAVIAGAWLVLAALGAVLVGRHHAGHLRAGPRGPEWLVLPLGHRDLERHLAWESRSRLPWLAVPALGVLAAAAGLLPLWWLPLLAAAFAALSAGAGQLGGAVGYRAARRAAESRPGLHPIAQVLAVAAPRRLRRRLPPAAWRTVPAWLVLLAKDLRVTVRLAATRRAALLPLALGAASLLAWQIAGDPGLRHFAAFALLLLAAATLAEWLVLLAGSDPFPVLRVLPVGVLTVWGARLIWGAAAAALLLVGHALAAPLTPPALHVFLVWSGAATLAIATLGINYGVTLFPRTDVAQRMLGLWLGLAVAASLMLPLSGWVVLLAGVLHSARRLPHWSRLEEA